MTVFYKDVSFFGDDFIRKIKDTVMLVEVAGHQFPFQFKTSGAATVGGTAFHYDSSNRKGEWRSASYESRDLKIIAEVPDCGWYSDAYGNHWQLIHRPDRQWKLGACSSRVIISSEIGIIREEAYAYAFVQCRRNLFEIFDQLYHPSNTKRRPISLTQNSYINTNAQDELLVGFFGFSFGVELTKDGRINPQEFHTLTDEFLEEFESEHM